MNCPYCNTPINEHEPKACLDAWIATEVFGATAWENPTIDFVGTSLFPLPYSSEIGSAWQIVEKLRLSVLPWGDAEWACANKRDERLAFSYILEPASTAPLAICRAALKAVEYERTQQASV